MLQWTPRAKSRSHLARALTQDRTLNPTLPSQGGTREFPIWKRVWALDHLALSMLSRKADGEDERGNQKGVGFMLLALIIK